MKDDNSNNNGFDEWYQDLKNQTPEKQSQILLDKMKEHLSKEDSECMDEIIKLLNGDVSRLNEFLNKATGDYLASNFEFSDILT